ncbi:MAG: four-carbon acid sugar kinase family protein [Burkholderiales bacterium]|nr:four-carbon acid sugar kinase family protein [Burkholderiales bacterium]
MAQQTHSGSDARPDTKILLGCIADDFTGATDLANTLVKAGMRTVQLLGVPRAGLSVPEADAVIVALKSRSNPAEEAVHMSLGALQWLQAAGARQFYFKYCSTFDSTDLGNIGPVADALLDALGARFTVFNPAFPTNRRTVYKGYLFVGDELLSESGMRHHPLTPMTDPSLVRVLQRQTPHKVELVPYASLAKGATAVREAFEGLRESGVRHAVLDSITDEHLFALGEACADLKLVTGGSGMAMGLPANFVRAGLMRTGRSAQLPRVAGPTAVLAGSCSVATQGQVAQMKRDHEAFELDPLAMAAGRDVAAEALAWAGSRLSERPILIYSTAAPEQVSEVQARIGREQAGELVERTMGRVAQGLVERGVRRMVVAGGETSGAVVGALGVEGLAIGPEIDPGVPWTFGIGAPTLALALKSGNFGGPDFFTRAFEVQP